MNRALTSGRKRLRFIVALSVLIAALLAEFGVSASAISPKPKPRQTATQAASGKLLTVERIYSSPSLSGYPTTGIEWRPDGKAISYLDRDKDGSLELWTMDAANGARKVLVKAETLSSVLQPEKTKAIQATGLGRIEGEKYVWSPTGDSLLFLGSNDLVLLDLRSMKSKTIVHSQQEMQDAKFSPDGKSISFVRNFNLWVVNLAKGGERPVTTGGSEEVLKGQLDWVYPEELDLTTAYWWSPDSSEIAYYEMDERPVTRYPIADMSSPAGATEYTRFPQAGEPNPIVRVGVVPVSGGGTQWMDTGAKTDVYPARVEWLRDSRRIAIERLNRDQNRLDLLIADASSGTSKVILSESDKYWINISDDLYFFADNQRFLWSSERTGFRHYYLYDLSGKQLDQLTTGDWAITGTSGFGPGAVDHPAVDEANGQILFLSNKDDATGTQLYRLSLTDKSVTPVTHGDGTHDVMVAPDCSGFVDTFSTAEAPPRLNLFRSSGDRVAAIDENKPADLANYRLSPVNFLSIAADDGTKLYAAMIKPPDFDPSKKYPVIIEVYGGPQIQDVRNAWGGTDFLWREMMAEKGYVIFSLDNRGTYNRGHAFETGVYHQLGKIELADQLAGVNYLKAQPFIDGSRIGIWGWSYGGYMTLDALMNAQDVFKAGVAVAPVSDWRLYDTIYTERYMGRPQDNPEGYANASPLKQAANLKGMLMIAHGTGDDNVHFANTSAVLNELIRHNRYPADVMVFPGRGHSIGDRSARIQLFERMTQFFMKYL